LANVDERQQLPECTCFAALHSKQKWCYIALKVVYWLVITGEPF